ncbi:thyroid receptor-interacting protein 6 isoform X2 [Scleropages formosus]|uniref:thyroid receptor-interacting protein 6 isoform X2 n=1 Tax=Scleropages formosus TaxID=113540 RepID=UPI0010FA8226|nr:thyroid receptor-interacting protein 6 isoform X2 [Scleropages formosus]
MSGPTWLPPRTLGSPERVTAQMCPSGPAFYRPPAKGNHKYGGFDQNGATGGTAPRYTAAGATGGVLPHAEDSGSSEFSPVSPKSVEHHYPSGHSSQEDRLWSLHGATYSPQNRVQENPVGHVYDNVPYATHLSAERYKGPPPQSRCPAGYPPYPQAQFQLAGPYPAEASHSAPPLGQYSLQQEYPYPSTPKPYPQPVPASYTTASTPTGPRFSVQVKTAQPVNYSQSGRHAEQAYAPPRPRPLHPYPESAAAPQPWYPAPCAAQEQDHGAAYKGGIVPGPRTALGPPPRRSVEAPMAAPSHGPAYQLAKGALPKPEEELERLTKKLVYDMNHPHSEEYFGRCTRCGDKVLGDGSGCVAMEQVFHVECFTCVTCHSRLRGQPFYALDKKSYCENCYIDTLERCSKCTQPILDRILRAMGKAYHPRCFTCVVCGGCLDGVPFTVDATSQIHCIQDFHRKFAPRCSVCGQPIMPEPGQEETVRIVALDRSFHVNCYTCEECGLLLSSEGEGRGCYPLDGHILCKSCSARRIQDLSAKISTDC